MIKLTAAIYKRDDWALDEWLTHYKERHASLSASVKAYTQYSRRYLQNYAYHGPEVPDFPERDDGRVAVTEHWFEDAGAIRAAYQEPDYFKYLRPDELRFTTFENLVAGIAREVELLALPSPIGNDKAYAHAPLDKIFVYRTRRPGLDADTFRRQWEGQRGPEIMRSAPFSSVKRYVQSYMIDEDVGLPGGVPHDAIDEFWFDSVADAAAFWTAYRGSAEIARQDVEYCDPGKTWIIIAREHEVFGPLPE